MIHYSNHLGTQTRAFLKAFIALIKPVVNSHFPPNRPSHRDKEVGNKDRLNKKDANPHLLGHIQV
jgi:hypothetical protein